MRFALGLFVLFIAAPAFAQTGDPKRNYDFNKPLYTVVDVASKGLFAGWSGNCNDGRQPSAITLWRVEGNQVVNVPATVTTGARPDAAAWLAATCNRPFDNNVGWSIVPKDAQMPGMFVVLATDIPASWSCRVMPVGYPNAGQTICDYVANEVIRIVQ